jgi:glycosyltransferase involved in cell wall biosynthesis
LAVSDETATRLASHTDAPVEVQPPGVAVRALDPEAEIARTCAKHALVPGQFVLYTGNLDAYQDLPLLDAFAAELPELPVVVATHETQAHRLEYARVHSARADEVRTLLQGARLFLAPRARRGGFPIKLLNAMEAGCPILAREGQTTTLAHEHNALLVAPDAPAGDFVTAARKLVEAPAFARALGMQARHTAELHHDWDVIAKQTLRFAEALLTRERS